MTNRGRSECLQEVEVPQDHIQVCITVGTHFGEDIVNSHPPELPLKAFAR